MKSPANHLVNETSPYLLQHAHNPVDWYPWGEAALEHAKSEGRPILLSIGYAACHWCHVMERESFENPDIAALMNQDFVCIKVDREERPDLDSIYMAATTAMNHGRGGWPMTVFCTPDGKPFFAGTYFPPEEGRGMPSFPRVLTHLADLWKNERDKLLGHAQEITQMLQRAPKNEAQAVGEQAVQRAVEHFAEEFDPTYGGFGAAPKFPHATTLQLLLRYAADANQAHDTALQSRARNMAVKTLHGMADGGMYDHIGGGFARYSVDEKWLVPHFEKMLYDNASLAQTYAEAFSITQEARFKNVAQETLDFVARDMTDAQGGFFTSYDADSIDERGQSTEGAFYVWTPAEIASVLGEREAARICAYFDVTLAGNFEGKSIPNTPRTLDDVARALGIESALLRESIEQAREPLRLCRAKRPAPGLDDKILTGWNGLMISAFAVGARVFGNAAYLACAKNAAKFVWETLRTDDGALLRTCRHGRAHLQAYLEDHAYLALGYIDLYEAGGGCKWLGRAETLCERILGDFIDPQSGAFFDTAQDHEQLLFRVREGHDGATPNANASAAWALARLGAHLDRPAWTHAAMRAIEAHGAVMERAPWAFCQALIARDAATNERTDAVFVGAFADDAYQRMWRAAQAVWVPRAIWVHHDPTHTHAPEPLAKDRPMAGGKPTLYVCHKNTCSAPVHDPHAAQAALRSPQALPADT